MNRNVALTEAPVGGSSVLRGGGSVKWGRVTYDAADLAYSLHAVIDIRADGDGHVLPTVDGLISRK